jgi:hypothetical protein
MPKLAGVPGHGAKPTTLSESPALGTGTMEEKSPRRTVFAQNDSVEIVSPKKVETEGADGTHGNPIRVARGGPLLVVAAREHQAHRPTPGVVVQTPVRVRAHETVQVSVPTECAEQVVALQVRLSLIAIDETTRQLGGDSIENAFEHGLRQLPRGFRQLPRGFRQDKEMELDKGMIINRGLSRSIR